MMSRRRDKGDREQTASSRLEEEYIPSTILFLRASALNPANTILHVVEWEMH